MNKKELDLEQRKLIILMNEKLDTILKALGGKIKKKKEKK